MKSVGFFKFVSLGCGTILVFLLLVAALGGFSYFTNKPQAVDMKHISLNEMVPADAKTPFLVKVKADQCQIEVLPNDQLELRVDAEMDQANYELELKPISGNKGQKITFRSKRSQFALVVDEMEGRKSNKLTIHLPKHVALRFDWSLTNSDVQADFSGLQVASYVIDGSHVDCFISTKEANPVRLEKADALFEFGAFNVIGYGLLNIKKARFHGQTCSSSWEETSPFNHEMVIDINVHLGAFQLGIPPKMSVEERVTVMLGGKQTHGEVSVGTGEYPPIQLEGSIDMAEYRVETAEYSIYRDILYSGYKKPLETFEADFRALQLGSEKPTLSANQVNRIGYRYIRNNRKEHALVAFQINIETYPDYANGWDSLAEGYLELGQLEKALEHYKKALEKDPNNKHASRQIGRIEDLISQKQGS